MGIKIMRREEKIIPIDKTDVGVDSAIKRVKNEYKGLVRSQDATGLKEKEPEVKQIEVIKSAPLLNRKQVTRVANMKNNKRAYRVMDRMRKRNLEDYGEFYKTIDYD
jgi:hypothetical protein